MSKAKLKFKNAYLFSDLNGLPPGLAKKYADHDDLQGPPWGLAKGHKKKKDKNDHSDDDHVGHGKGHGKKVVFSEKLDNLGIEQVERFVNEDESGAEVVAEYDGKLYVTNPEADTVDFFDIETGDQTGSIDLTGIAGYGGVQSVDVGARGIIVAVDVLGDTPQNGIVALFDLEANGNDAPLAEYEVGNLPDMVTYSKDGKYAFVANEGERDGTNDPAGSISIIDLENNDPEDAVNTYGFEDFDDPDTIKDLLEAGVRLFPDGQPAFSDDPDYILPSLDFEPEYIAEGKDGKLYVSLQEANAIAVFDLAAREFTKIIPLGTVDHSLDGNGLDPLDKGGEINIRNAPVVGLRMPDAIATAYIDGETYLVTANEGDGRGDYFLTEEVDDEDVIVGLSDFGDEARVGDLLANDGAFGAVRIDDSVDTGGLERLTISVIDGDTDGDGDIDQLHAYGSRSFTIFDTDGNVVFDSGDAFEQYIADNRVPNAFNNDDFRPSVGDPNEVDDGRSDNKGPEPEAMAVGKVEGHLLAFVGLERDSGIMIYDISDPEMSVFVDYIDSSEFGDFAPEVIDFISAKDSLSGLAQIAVAYEDSGSTALFDLEFGRKILGTNKSDDIHGTIGDDKIFGGNGKDKINGKGGDDLIKGENGKDKLLGGAGDDKVYGGNGKDQLWGGSGDDVLNGGNGKDYLTGGIGNDILTGGRGKDWFKFELGDGEDEITDFDRKEVIDLSATGLSYEDLEITKTGLRNYQVVYGDEDDLIEVELVHRNAVLDEDSFLF